jgi:ubiquinone/menaquinone biosynthesis C-methylase UbiE
MQKQWTTGETVRETYDAWAPVYDEFNQGYLFERWTGKLVEKAEEAGMEGKRLLDIACGTGMSTIPMLDRGWSVTGCDISPGMLEIARGKIGEAAILFEADMRELPDVGKFDLVWAINDPLNYLLDVEELEATLDGMRRNLHPQGIALFDLNTLVTYRTFFSNEIVVEADGRKLTWQGRMSPEEVAPGTFAEARFEVPGQAEMTSVHRQRHFSEAGVRDAIARAGLECIALYGELEGELSPGVDENHHTKMVFLCRAK